MLAGSYSWDGLAFRYDGKNPPILLATCNEGSEGLERLWDDLGGPEGRLPSTWMEPEGHCGLSTLASGK
jgi:hypothetical protein